jgi:hypothetical protein
VAINRIQVDFVCKAVDDAVRLIFAKILSRFTAFSLRVLLFKQDLEWWLRQASIEFEVKNLFDEKYVGAIYASDTATDVDYYAGSPFTVIFSIGGKF